MVIINGEKVEDSSFIIDRLVKDMPQTDIDKDLTDQQRSLTIAFQRLIEDSLNLYDIYNFKCIVLIIMQYYGLLSLATSARLGTLQKSNVWSPCLADK